MLEALAGDERVVDPVRLARARFAGGAGHRVAQIAIELEEALDQGVLSDARWSGEDDE